MNSIPVYSITKENVTVVLDGQTTTVLKGTANFERLREALLDEDWEAVPGLLTVAKSIETWSEGDFTVRDEQVCCKDEPLPSELNDRIIQMVKDGCSPINLLNFWERLQKNPSYRSVQQLYGFLAHANIPIDPDGTIWAYKSVRPDFRDWHSGTYKNTVGAILEMPRNKISDDPNMACHIGFHVGALEYALTFGEMGKKIMIVRVNPEDVVCVPYDCSQRKMRVCKYEVMGHYAVALPSTTIKDETEESPEQYQLPKSKYLEMDHMVKGLLFEESLHDLRKYAAHHLKIVGACKIPGGKAALIDSILEVRRR
jgi:hypothetical protein